MSYKILVSAGEVSGDQHLARVVRELRALAPSCEIRGMAGRSSQEAGVSLDVDCYRASAGMGFFELFRSGGKVLSSFKTLKRLLWSWKPDLLVVVDYPDFNLRLAKVAKRAGVKVLYFIPPKVWAWRSGRVKSIKKVVDHIAAIFPFEKSFYKKHGYDQVSYVGHPLADQQSGQTENVEPDNTILLLPGSRRFEVERLLVPMLKACELLSGRFPDFYPVVLLAPNIDVEWVKAIVREHVSEKLLSTIRWSFEAPLVEMRKARVGVLKSGTCNLEGAIAGLPFVSVYSGTFFAKIIVDLFVALREYSPVNIIRPKTVQEIMQVHLDPDKVALALELLIQDGPLRDEVQANLAQVARALSSADGSACATQNRESVARRVARCIESMIRSNHGAEERVGLGVSHV